MRDPDELDFTCGSDLQVALKIAPVVERLVVDPDSARTAVDIASPQGRCLSHGTWRSGISRAAGSLSPHYAKNTTNRKIDVLQFGYSLIASWDRAEATKSARRVLRDRGGGGGSGTFRKCHGGSGCGTGARMPWAIPEATMVPAAVSRLSMNRRSGWDLSMRAGRCR